MEYRILGKTGLSVSVIGFGGIPVQRISKEEAVKVIERAEELGINFIDTARGYGISEAFIGEALKENREKWIIASKTMVRDKEAMKTDIDISLRNLQTDYIDLYQFHNVRTMEDYKSILSEDGAYAALEEAKVAGKVRHIGITSHSLELLKIAVESGKFETIMYPYNIVETQAQDLFKRAYELNIGVIAMKPMAGGALTDGTRAMKFILENKSITTAIPGMASIQEVEENSKVGCSFAPLTHEEMEKALKDASELGDEFCRRCGYCAPCHRGIDIPTMFMISGYKERYNLATWAEERYAAMKKTAVDCTECGACEGKCPYNLPIRKMLKEVRKTFKK